ncbi:type IV pilin protein [Terrisporobacter sp.]
MKNNNKGFTLVELLIVIAIIGILTTIAVPSFLGHKRKAEQVAELANAKAVYDETAAMIINDEIPLAHLNKQFWFSDALTIGNKKYTAIIPPGDYKDTKEIIDAMFVSVSAQKGGYVVKENNEPHNNTYAEYRKSDFTKWATSKHP